MNESLKILLAGVVDYAGLFPPAELSMTQAVENYARHRASRDAPMLGRFIVPLARLSEFTDSLVRLAVANDSPPWFLSVLGGSDLRSDFERIAEFNNGDDDSRAHSCIIDALELKANTIKTIEKLAEAKQELARMQSMSEVYCEIPIADDPSSFIKAIAQVGACAKVRTGGTIPEAFPSTTKLARFIHLCAQRGVAFKATAGLHHPLRSINRLTYEPDSPTALMHGFLNVFVAAAFAREQAEIPMLVEILEERDIRNFQFESDGIMWRDHSVNLQQLKNARGELAVSFGSCSFAEPTDDLRALNLL